MNPSVPNSASDVPSIEVHSGGSVASTSTSSTSTVPSNEAGLSPSVANSPVSHNKYLSPTTTVPTKRVVHQVSSVEPGIKQKEAYSPVSSNNVLTLPTNVHNKRIIRKITPIDPKKLQQAGLDRKIAEALSKHKSLQAASSKLSNRTSNVRPTPSSTVSSPAATNVSSVSSPKPTRPTIVQTTPSPAKTLLTTKTIIPPKITITAPESSPEIESPDMTGLSSQQRLEHVKNLLNKKLIQKKHTFNCDNVRLYQHLKPPSPLTGSPKASSCATSNSPSNSPSSRTGHVRNPIKNFTEELTGQKETPPRPPQTYCNLKETEITTPPLKPIKTKTPQKSPQDIARKLDFQTEAVQKQPLRTYSKCLNKELNEIPKAAIKAANSQQQTSNNPPATTPLSAQHYKQNKEFSEVNYTMANDSLDFQTECLKQSKNKDNIKIPKAAIKAGNNPQQSNNIESNLPQSFRLLEHNSEHRLDFQNAMPLKVTQAANNVSSDFQNKDNNNQIPKAVIKAGNTQPQSNSLESYSPHNFRFFQHTEQNLALTESPYTASHVPPATYHMQKAPIKTGYIQQLTNTPPSFRPFQYSEQNMSHNINQIPKASIKSGYGQQQPNIPQNFSNFQPYEQRQDVSNVIPLKVYAASNISQDFQTEYLKQQKIRYPKTKNTDFHEIPKAAIKSGHNQQQYSNTNYSYKQKIDFPEVSPLKMPFPTVNVPKETPLPTIDSFKKPYPMVNAVYYNLPPQSHGHHTMHSNYETLYTQPVTSFVNNAPLETFHEAAAAASTTSNCLIVLENKVLSQDEMIDLTELRLSSTNTPRFVNPHKPIPEVVIKQEKSDEYAAANTPSPPNIEQTSPVDETKEIIIPNIEASCDKVVISNKQNKKIIINAQKLKLPPQQLADLAKKIKERTALATTNQENKSGDIRILNTKAASRKIISPLAAKHTAYVLPHNNDINNKEIPDIPNPMTKYFIHNKPMYMDANKQDHNYQLNQPPTEFRGNINTKSYIVKPSNNFQTLNRSLAENPEKHLNTSADLSMLRVKEEPKTLDINAKSQPNLSEHTNSDNSFMDSPYSEFRKSAVEIIDEPEDAEDCFSAVDFITALNNTNPITEETSLELSPEELNLNASCAMNLSPLRIQSYPPRLRTTSTSAFKPYTPKHDNCLDPEPMSTIVIESSKGPETIITNESPNKYGTLQKVKMFSNLGMCDMDIETPIENVQVSGHSKQKLVLEPLKEPKNIDLTNVIVASDPEKIKLIISQVNAGHEAKNNNNSPRKCVVENTLKSSGDADKIKPIVSQVNAGNEAKNNNNSPRKGIDNNTLRSSGDSDKIKSIISQVNAGNEVINKNNSPRKGIDNNTLRSSGNYNDTVTKSPETLVNTTKEFDTATTSKEVETVIAAGQLQNIPVHCKSISENTIEQTQIKDSKPSKLPTNHPEHSLTKDHIKTPEKPANLKSILKSATTGDDQHRDKCETAKPLEVEMPTNTTSISKSSNEAAKTNETSSANTVTSKRISRFKKGKINLVQRNKAGGSGPNKPKTVEKKTETNNETLNKPTKNENAAKEIIDETSREENKNHELKQNSDNIPKAAIKTGQSPAKSPAKTGQLEKAEERIEFGKSNQIEDKNKDLELSTIITPITSYNKMDDSNENTEKSENAPTEAYTRKQGIEHDVDETVQGVTKENTTEMSAKSESTEANTRKQGIEHDLDNTIKGVSKETITTMSSKISNVVKSSEKACIKPLIVDNNEIPKAAIKTGHSPQIPTKSPQKEVEQIMDLTVVTPEKPQETTTKLSSDQNHKNKSPENISQPIEISEVSTSPSSMKTTKTQTPKKSPHDINRKLDFEIELETRVEQQQKSKESNLIPETPESSSETEQSPQQSLTKTPQKFTELHPTEMEIDFSKTTPEKATISQIKDLPETPENTYLSAIPVGVNHVPQSPQNLTETNAIQDNIENISYGNITPQLESTTISKIENLDPVSKAILKNMRNAKVSLIDIVKHSPQKPPETSPVIPFKKKTQETEIKEKTPEIKGIKTLLKQLKSNNKEMEEKHQQAEENSQNTSKDVEETETSLKETRRSLPNLSDVNQLPKIIANKRSNRLSLGDTPILPAALKPTTTTRKRHSTRPLISDDDLEFLPVNAEVKFKLSKSMQNEKETSLHTTPTSSNSNINRRTRLYSKPLEMELSKHSSPLTKRTRYYSQTLETNVTIRFDALKSATSPNGPSPLNLKHLKPLDTEDSCHDSTQDSNKLIPTKQRKKLRKTLEDIKKSQKSHTDSDSEDENRDYDDCCPKDCEEGNEFLGFEENADSSFKASQNVNNHNDENNKMGKTKGGTLKNWLTTGKAIAPTSGQEELTKQIRHADEIPATSPIKRSGSGGMKPFKKRWDLSNSRNEETDITDDTSPADDEEESAAEQIPTTKKSKRGIKNVIDSNKELLDSKKIKLDESLEKTIEHSFIKPRHLRTISKNSGTDSETHEEKTMKGQKPRLRITNLQENLPISTKSKEDADTSKETVNENSATDSDCHKGKARRMKKGATSGTDSDCHEETRQAQSTNKEDNIEKHSENSGIDNDCDDRTESRQEKTKKKGGNSEKINDLEKVADKSLEKAKKSGHDSDSLEARESKRLKTKTRNKDLDKSLKSHNTDSDCTDRTESKQLKPKENTQQDDELEVAVTSKNSGHDSDTHEVKGSKRLKSKLNAEDVDKSLDKSRKSHNAESDSHKGKRSRRLKSKHMTDDDIAKSLDISEKHNKSENFKNKDKKENSCEKSKKKSSKEHDLETKNAELQTKTEKQHDTTAVNSPRDNENSAIVAECTTKKSSPETKTPQNKTAKKKRGRPIVKTEHIAKTPTIKENLNDTATSSLVRSLKRALSTDSSDDEGPLVIIKKRSLKSQPKRKLKIDDSDSDSTSTPLKKTNENTTMTDDLTPIATARLALVKSETPTSTGRKRKYNITECNFNPRLLLITKREQLETKEVLTETKPGSGSIQCGLCLGRTTKWIAHLAEHYGVGWQMGQVKLNVENRSVVLNCILNYMKSTSSKGLSCRMCKKEYRSGLGILTHIETCGAQVARVICEYCKRDYAPSTLPIHIRTCYAKTALENQSAEHKLEEIVEKQEEVFGNTGRLKRNSTIKAENKLKVLGAELEKVPDSTKNEKPAIDPKSRIRYVPPLEKDAKWSEDIQKFGKAVCPKKLCKFSSNDLKEFSEHLKNCKYIKTGYFCNFCRQRVFATEKEAIDHVIKNHNGGRRARKKSEDSDCNLKTDDEQSSDDNYLSEGVDENEEDDVVSEEEDDFEEACDNSRKGSKKQSKKPYSRNVNHAPSQASRKEVFDGRFTDLNKEVLKKWKSFLKLNYTSEPLYAEFTAQYSVLNQQDFNKYLPKQTVSMKFNMKTKPALTGSVGQPEENIEWSELKRYESIHNKMNTYFFMGAPVKLCSWLPLPAHVHEQYLAVVYRQDMFKFIKFAQPTQHHTIILIIKVTQNNQTPKLDIQYGFVVPDGPVHHVAFLPSGGYDESSNRLGLVAVATVTSTIKVYSLPLNVENLTTPEASNNNDHITLIEVKPSFLLNLDILDQQQTPQQVLYNAQCLQICWSEFSGHQHIFASFSNGCMGIWDINNDSQENLNRFVVDDVANYAPLNYFYVGEKRVKCFALHYDTSGPRWLAVSGAYRKFIIYDIKSFMQPIVMKEEVNKNILLSMDWCPLWETLLYSYCDSIPNNGRCVMTVNPTNIMFPQNKLDFMLCGVTQVHYTPVANMCVSALDNGDVVFLDTKELHYECPLSKKFGERRMLYAMDVKQLNGKPLATLPKGNDKNANTNVPSEWSMQDDQYKEKYGLIFQPLLKLKEEYKGPYLSEQRCPPSNVIPLMRINTLRCNLNLNAKNLIALGYENGFLRLVYFNKDNL